MYINKPNFYKPIRVAKVPDYETIPNELYNDLYTAINENNSRGALIRVEAGYYQFGTETVTVRDTTIVFDDGVVVEIGASGTLNISNNVLLKGNAIFQAQENVNVPYLLIVSVASTEETYSEIDGLTLVNCPSGGTTGGIIGNEANTLEGAVNGVFIIRNCLMKHQVVSSESTPVIALTNRNDIAIINTNIRSNSNGIYIADFNPLNTVWVMMNSVIMELDKDYYLDSETDTDVFAVNTYVTKPMGSTASITERITDGLTVEQYVKAY